MYYGGRLFRPVKTSDTSQTGADTIFKYEQNGDMVTATYSGGNIRFGQIIGQVDETGTLDMRCLLYTSPSPRDRTRSRMPSSA